jgi:hypothetical protein
MSSNPGGIELGKVTRNGRPWGHLLQHDNKKHVPYRRHYPTNVFAIGMTFKNLLGLKRGRKWPKEDELAAFLLTFLKGKVFFPHKHWKIISTYHARYNIYPGTVQPFCFIQLHYLQLTTLKGPKHDQVECGFFYTNQTRMVRWLGDWQKKLFSFMIGADIRHFVFLAKVEHTLKIM